MNPCPTGKVPLTNQRAQQVAKKSSSRHDKPMGIFKCPECGEWHLGQTNKRKKPIPYKKGR